VTTALCAAHARKVALSAQSAKATANTLSMPTNASAAVLAQTFALSELRPKNKQTRKHKTKVERRVGAFFLFQNENCITTQILHKNLYNA